MRSNHLFRQIVRGMFLSFMLLLGFNLASAQTHVDKGDLSWAYKNPNLKPGTISVPENHDDPDGKQIEIAYVVFRAKDTTSKAYPLIFFSGGPGGNTIDPGMVGFLSQLPFHEKMDIILFDQRGIGYSSAMPNMGYDSFKVLAQDADANEELELTREMIAEYKKKCADQGINPEFYNSRQNALDVGMLFEHLGYDKYNLLGGSYGTILARMVQDLFPEKVHTSILDSPALLSTDFLQMRLRNYSLALTRILDNCQNTASCNEKYPNLKSDYFRAIARLKERPIKVGLNDSTDFYINAQDGIYLLRRLLYQENSREKAPELIQAFIKGEGEIIKNVLEFEYQLTDALNLTMLLSVEKSESIDPDYTADVIDESYKKYPLIPAKLGFFDAFYQAGTVWHDGSLPKSERQFKESKTPSLIFVNRYDPVTPPENGHVFKEKLVNGRLFILDEGGHGGGNQMCKFNIMLEFMADPQSKLNTDCLNLYRE